MLLLNYRIYTIFLVCCVLAWMYRLSVFAYLQLLFLVFVVVPFFVYSHLSKNIVLLFTLRLKVRLRKYERT